MPGTNSVSDTTATDLHYSASTCLRFSSGSWWRVSSFQKSLESR